MIGKICTFSIAALALGLVCISPSRMAEVPPATGHLLRRAEKEGCNQCKFADCIRNTIKNKQALMQGYKELAGEWGKFWTSTDSGQRVELTEIDWGKMNESSKKSTLEALSDEFKKYKEDVEKMTNRIGPTKGCGYEFSSGGLEMETNPLTCNINMPLARKVEEAVPCKELYEIAFRHETMHLQKCQARLSSKKLLTPAGLAFEEAEGYAQEIAELERLLEGAIKTCKFNLKFESEIERKQGAAGERGRVRASLDLEAVALKDNVLELGSAETALEYLEYTWWDRAVPSCRHSGSGTGGRFRIRQGQLELKPVDGPPKLVLAAVTLDFDPGETTEVHTVDCGRGPMSFEASYWSAAFSMLHGGRASVPASDWALEPSKEILARKVFEATKECNNATCKEKTTLLLQERAGQSPVALQSPFRLPAQAATRIQRSSVRP